MKWLTSVRSKLAAALQKRGGGRAERQQSEKQAQVERRQAERARTGLFSAESLNRPRLSGETLLVGVFILMILAMQYPLWLGKGSWRRALDLDQQASVARERADKLEVRNNALRAEIVDLRAGGDAVEERARFELGMVKPGELLYQTIEPAKREGAAPFIQPMRP